MEVTQRFLGVPVLNDVSQKIHSSPKALVPMNVTLFENRDFCRYDQINVNFTLEQSDPLSQMADVPLKEGEIHRGGDTQEERRVIAEAEMSDVSINPGRLRIAGDTRN